MDQAILFVFWILDWALRLLSYAIIASAILSWLVAFDIINLRNRAVYKIAVFLEALVRPVLYPLQRMIPPLGGMDITPIIALLLISLMRSLLLPNAQAALLTLAAGG